MEKHAEDYLFKSCAFDDCPSAVAGIDKCLAWSVAVKLVTRLPKVLKVVTRLPKVFSSLCL